MAKRRASEKITKLDNRPLKKLKKDQSTLNKFILPDETWRIILKFYLPKISKISVKTRVKKRNEIYALERILWANHERHDDGNRQVGQYHYSWCPLCHDAELEGGHQPYH